MAYKPVSLDEFLAKLPQAQRDRIDARAQELIREADLHREAIEEINALWGAKPGTPEGDRLDALVDAVDAYEDGRGPIETAFPK